MKALGAWRGGLFLTEGKIRVLSVSSLFLTRVGVYVGVCVCIRTHTHTLHRWGTWLWAQESGWDTWRLKRSIHVDCIGVQSTFVYIYAGLRVLMIWANCLFFLSQVFSFEKSEGCDNNQQTIVTHFSENKRLHPGPWKFQTKLIHYFFLSNNKSNLHITWHVFGCSRPRFGCGWLDVVRAPKKVVCVRCGRSQFQWTPARGLDQGLIAKMIWEGRSGVWERGKLFWCDCNFFSWFGADLLGSNEPVKGLK